MAPKTRLTSSRERRISEQRIVDTLLRDNVGPDTARLYRIIVRRLYDELKTLPPMAQLNLVTEVCAMLYKVSSASSAYANQNLGVTDAATDFPPPKMSLTDIMVEKLRPEKE